MASFFACWYKFTKIKSWTNIFWLGMIKNGCGCGLWTLKLTVSQEWTDGMKWFLACWYKFMQIKRWFFLGWAVIFYHSSFKITPFTISVLYLSSNPYLTTGFLFLLGYCFLGVRALLLGADVNGIVLSQMLRSLLSSLTVWHFFIWSICLIWFYQINFCSNVSTSKHFRWSSFCYCMWSCSVCSKKIN